MRDIFIEELVYLGFDKNELFINQSLVDNRKFRVYKNNLLLGIVYENIGVMPLPDENKCYSYHDLETFPPRMAAKHVAKIINRKRCEL